MSAETVARRYASALADVVLNSGNADEVDGELKSWRAMLDDAPDLASLFADPSVAHADKRGVLERLIERVRPSQSTANFLRVLLGNGRLNDLAEIIKRFDAELEVRKGNVVATITSARELTDAERSELGENLVRLTGKNIRPEFIIDRDIIGGVVTRIGSTVYDGSVRTQLNTLRDELIGA